MNNFIFNAYTKILFGKGQIVNLPEVLREYGKNVLLVYGGGSIKKIGLYDTIKELLKDYNVIELAGVEPNPRIDTVRKGVEICKENNIDVVLAVGGGSTIDCSKAIAAGYYYENDVWDLVVNASLIDKVLPIVSVLTLAATGSEMNKNSVISNMETNEKLGTASTTMIPKCSVLDPEYTYSVPKIQTAAGTADIMSHVFENYFKADKDTYVQDRFSEGILKACIKYCPVALEAPNDYEARANLMWSSTMALNGLLGVGKAGAWSCHPIEHEISAYYDITHGVGLAILTPQWMRYILSDNTAHKFAEYAVNVWGVDPDGDKMEIANIGIDMTEQFFKDCGIPMKLSEIGVDDSKFELMAEKAVHFGELKYSYVALDKDDVVNIFKMSL